METQNLHSEGENDYLEILKKNLGNLVKKIKNDTTLSKKEREGKIKQTIKEYKYTKK